VRSTLAACLVLLTSTGATIGATTSVAAQPSVTPPPVAPLPLPDNPPRQPPADKPKEPVREPPKGPTEPKPIPDDLRPPPPAAPDPPPPIPFAPGPATTPAAPKPAAPPRPEPAPPAPVATPPISAPAPAEVAPPPVDPHPLAPASMAVGSTVATEAPVVVGDRTEIPPGVYARRRLVLPSQMGPVGLYRLSAADAGDVGQVRLALHGEYASADDFLVRGSRNRRLAGTLSVGVTALRYLEVFGAILATTNRNDRCATGAPGCTPDPERVDPTTIRAFGDLVFGAKVARPILPGLRLGAEGGLRLFAGNDGMSLDGDSTSGWVTALGTVDLREARELPLLVHLNVGYYADQSQNLQDFSRFRPSMLPSRLVTTFAYGMGGSRLRTGVGLAVPLMRERLGIGLEPFAEYHVDLVTADPDLAYAAFMPPECDMPGRTCVDNRDQQWISFGLRSQMKAGFSVTAGLDITLRSTGFPYGPALLPWNFLIGIAQAFDFSGPPKMATRTVTLQRTVEKQPPPREGFVTGKVMNAAQDGEPIAGALVSVVGRSRARVATDVDGSFATKGLPPGPVKLEVSAPAFETQLLDASVVLGETTEIQATLRPSLPPPRLEGRVADASNRPLTSARIRIVGPTSAELATDVGGRFSAELAPGAYIATIDAPGQAPQEQRFELRLGQVFPLEVNLTREQGAPALSEPSSGPPPVAYDGGKLVVRRPLSFRVIDGNPSADLVSTSRTTLEALAKLLNATPAITKVRIEAHWDSAVGREQADAITQKQAQSIADFLVLRGVARARLDPVGLGASKPKVPNLSPTTRAQNRRVEITVAN
jgi:outer membrane protein OmpA-like peptidoglycan-associated protein